MHTQVDPLIEIDAISAAGAPLLLADLIRLLSDAVEHGASLGFLHPLSHEAARRYWAGVLDELTLGHCKLWIARANGNLVGTVQLGLCGKENGRNRAEVQKLMVHSQWQGKGIARLLMAAVEGTASRLDRGLLFLDTEAGSGAEGFYTALGYQRVGEIPDYAASPNGTLHPTALYYKVLIERSTEPSPTSNVSDA